MQTQVTPRERRSQRDPLRYTLVSNKFDHEPKRPVSMACERFTEQLAKCQLLPPNLSKDGLAIIFAVFIPGERIKRANVTAVTALGMDVDGDITKGQDYLSPEALHRLMPFEMIGWSTYSSTPSSPRYRAIFPFAAEYTVEEYARLWTWANAQTGGKLMDPACKNADRLYFTPRWPEGSQDRWVRHFAGPKLSIDDVPATFVHEGAGLSPGHAKPRSARRKHGAHPMRAPRREALALLETMLRHPLITWMREAPDDVGREVWRGAAQNLVCAVIEHGDLLERAREEFHALSQGYAGYSWSDTERAFMGAIDSVRDNIVMTFSHMAANGMPEEHWSAGATALIHAARLTCAARRGGAR